MSRDALCPTNKKIICTETSSAIIILLFLQGPIKEGKDVIKRLGSTLNKKTGDSKINKYLKVRISTQRGNATSILNTFTENERLDVFKL